MAEDHDLTTTFSLMVEVTHSIDDMDRLIAKLVDARFSRSLLRTEELSSVLRRALADAELRAQRGEKGVLDSLSECPR